MFAAFALFFLTVGLGQISASLIGHMTDSKVTKTLMECTVFAIAAPVATAFWCGLWLWFKKPRSIALTYLSSWTAKVVTFHLLNKRV